MIENLFIVGGPPRSGTRFITTALNQHPDIHLEGEMYRSVLLATLKFFKKADTHTKRKKADKTLPEHSRKGIWDKRKSNLFFEMVRAGQKVRVEENTKQARNEGFKLPQTEFLWSSLLEISGGYTFVYCLRPFEPHYLSCINRWPYKKISGLAAEYTESIANAHLMLEHPDIRFAAFSIEALERAGREHLVEVATRLKLHDPEEWSRRVDPGKKTNSAEKFGGDKRYALNEEERAFVAEHPELDEAYRGFWSTYNAVKVKVDA